MSIRLFVSYQRSDSRHAAGRLRDRLSDSFGDENVFFDVDSIDFGMDFRTVIRDTLKTVDAVITVIGPHFDPSRLADQDDYVRQELEEALRQEKLVVPVLVDEAQVPRPSELPEQLRILSYRNAAVVRPDPDFRRDVARLVESLKRAISVVSSGADQAAIPVASEIGQLSTTVIENEEQARREAEEQARREAEEQARREAEKQARRSLAPSGFAVRRTKAEERAERRAEEQARRETEEQARIGPRPTPTEAEHGATRAQRVEGNQHVGDRTPSVDRPSERALPEAEHGSSQRARRRVVTLLVVLALFGILMATLAIGTAGGGPKVELSADQTTVSQADKCATLRWRVSGADRAFLDSQEIPLIGEAHVCPSSTASYTVSGASASGEKSSSGAKTVRIAVTNE